MSIPIHNINMMIHIIISVIMTVAYCLLPIPISNPMDVLGAADLDSQHPRSVLGASKLHSWHPKVNQAPQLSIQPYSRQIQK